MAPNSSTFDAVPSDFTILVNPPIFEPKASKTYTTSLAQFTSFRPMSTCQFDEPSVVKPPSLLSDSDLAW